ncbi:MAG: hypothetical protein PVH88_07350 [Ignavibacteria bacterium]
MLTTFEGDSIKITFVMVWRNTNKKQHYAPYNRYISSTDFIKFKNNRLILFEDDLPDLYKSLTVNAR